MKHGDIIHEGDGVDSSDIYFCAKCSGSHGRVYLGCDGLRGGYPPPSALDTQVAGGHYKDLKIQPIEYIHANSIPFAEGCAIKYLTRWRNKGGIEDLKKARHFIDLLIELETKV